VYGERRTGKREREMESVAVMCNGELYRGRKACEAKRDLNWRWNDMWVSPQGNNSWVCAVRHLILVLVYLLVFSFS